MTTTTLKMPLWLAILVNINIVIGASFFLNSSSIAASAGALAPFAWIIFGILLLPLVLVLANLSRIYPLAGGLYVYSKQELGPLWGFLSGWGYFIGSAAGNAVVIHALSEFAYHHHALPALTNNPTTTIFIVDIFAVMLFMIANLLNLQILSTIQIFLTALKCLPLFLVLIALPFLFDITNITTAPLNFTGLFGTVPLVLFSYIGIEACCAITHTIQNGQENAARAMLISFILIMGIYAFVQAGLLAICGSTCANPFGQILQKLFLNPLLITWGNGLIYMAIGASYLGGFYGMFFSNNWNLFAMAEENCFIGKKVLIKLNSLGAPQTCVAIQGFLIMGLLTITHNLLTLQIWSDVGVFTAYILSAIAFFIYIKRNKSRYNVIAICAFVSCSFLLYTSIVADGLIHLMPFICVMLFGLFNYALAKAKLNI